MISLAKPLSFHDFRYLIPEKRQREIAISAKMIGEKRGEVKGQLFILLL